MARILVVDDEPLTIGMLRDALEAAGHQVTAALDGLKALDYLGVEPPADLLAKAGITDWKLLKGDWSGEPEGLPELVLSDCMMPRMDGFTLVTVLSVSERVKGLPVIVLTSKPKMEEPFLQLSNVKGFIAKPVSPADLRALVDKVLAKA